MPTAYTSLLGLALPVTGELSGTWGDTVNNSITSLLDTSVAGTTNVSTDADVTLTTTTGASNTSRQAILLFSGARTALRTVTAPAQSKIYTVINATTGGFAVKLVGAGPTTGLTIPNGASAIVAWNGSDFIEIGTSSIGNLVVNGTLTVTGATTLQSTLAVTGATTLSAALTYGGVTLSNAVTGTGNMVLATSPTLVTPALGTPSALVGTNITGTATSFNINGTVGATTPTTGAFTTLTTSSTVTLNGGTANGVAYLNGSKVVTSGSALVFDGSNLGLGVTPSAWATYTTLQIKNGSVSNYSPTQDMRISSNAYYNSGWKYIASAPACQYLLDGSTGSHQWFTAASGTAGNAITFTQAMTLTAAGELFLGATSSAFAEKFRVYGNYAVFDNGTFTGFIGSGSSLGTGTGSDFAIRSSNALAFLTGGATERARIDTSGNFGIGTSSPAYKLDVQTSNSSNVDGVTVRSTSSSASAGASLILNGYGNSWGIVCGSTARNSNALTFSLDALGTPSEKMRLDNTGNLGIGTSSPAYKLDVNGVTRLGAGSPAILAGVGGAFVGGQGELYTTSTNNMGIGTTGAASLCMYTNSTERARIDSSGNLGIGTSSPSQKLDVAGSVQIQSTGVFYLNNSDNTNQYYWQNTGATGANNATLILSRTNAGETLRVDSSGNLLVGTTNTTPSSSNVNGFVVNPTGYISLTGNATSAIDCNRTNDGIVQAFRRGGTLVGNVSVTTTATAFNTSSDYRLKENITDADSASTLIDSLQVRQFDWKSDNSHQRYGFVAQELVTVAPEAVHQPADPEEMMAVDYSKLVPMLVKEIQSLRKRLADAGIA